MIFLNYEFVFFAAVLFIPYYLCGSPGLRKLLLLLSGVGFLYLYGGWTSLFVVVLLSLVTFLAGGSGHRVVIDLAICFSAAALLFFKYTNFLLVGLVSWLVPACAGHLHAAAAALLPVATPLGISFFTFEFVHYLVDVRQGHPPIRKAADFASFGLFWPTLVAGPIKRYEQFIPAWQHGLAGPTSADLAQGLARIAIGLVKKWGADNLTGWMVFFDPQFSSSSVGMRWIFLAALSTRILLDFSGYSDIAIGFARMLGIQVPENFNFPYLARSPAEFWQRWHMSLSSWIRDYIYIPLGGNRLGPTRRVVNGLTAMAICGLWHGASWNFVLWGVYHGVGLAAGSALGNRRPFFSPERRQSFFLLSQILTHGHDAVAWAATLLFVCLGWLLFFYPVDRAVTMALQLFAI